MLLNPPAACNVRGTSISVATTSITNCTTSVTTTAQSPPTTVYNATTNPQINIDVSSVRDVAVFRNNPSAYKRTILSRILNRTPPQENICRIGALNLTSRYSIGVVTPARRQCFAKMNTPKSAGNTVLQISVSATIPSW